MMRECLFILVVVILVGCAPNQFWHKEGADQSEFYRTRSYCEALASGATPMDYSYQGSTTSYHSGSVRNYSTGASARYTGTTTTYGNSTGQAMYNLGQGLSRKRIFNECMYGHGFYLQKKFDYSDIAYDSKDVELLQASVVQDLEDWENVDTDIRKTTTKYQVSLLSKPTFAGKKIATIPGKESLEVLSETGAWFKVNFSEYQGYVAKNWVDIAEPGK